MSDENKCDGDHSEHVCQLMVDRNKNLAKITGMVKHPRFICFNCARVAEREDNLCNPMPIE